MSQENALSSVIEQYVSKEIEALEKITPEQIEKITQGVRISDINKETRVIGDNIKENNLRKDEIEK